MFLVTLRWKVIARALTSAFAQLFAAWIYYGFSPIRDWMHALLNVSPYPDASRTKALSNPFLRTF